jgi:hypothetical protein
MGLLCRQAIWLENGIEPNLVADHDPAAHVEARGAHGVTA